MLLPKNEKRETRDEKRSFHVSGFSFLVLLMMALRAPAQAAATDIYISQAGGGNGSSCSSAQPVSFFNNVSNWGSGVGQIGPGTTVHLCGTFTGSAGGTLLHAQGGGTSGHPVTILFEPGADLQAPYWFNGGSDTGGAIDIHNLQWIVVDGGSPCGYVPATNSTTRCNGTIENTANGSAVAYQQATMMIPCAACTNVEVKNLFFKNLYVRVGNPSSSPEIDATTLTAFHSTSASGVSFHNNIVSNGGWCVEGADHFYNNDIGECQHGYVSAPSTMYMYNNHFHDWDNWDASCAGAGGCPYHDDGLHCFAGQGGATQTAYIYDNRFDGKIPTNGMNQFVFIEGGASTTRCMLPGGTVYAFNNVMLSGNQSFPAFGAIYGNDNGGDSGDVWANNIGIGTNPGSGTFCMNFQSTLNARVENNACGGTGFLNTAGGGGPGPTYVAVDYNAYENCSGFNCFSIGGVDTGSFATYRANGNCTGAAGSCDTHGLANLGSSTYFNIDASGEPLPGSPLVGSGTNLSSVCNGQPNPGLGALCYDFAGNLRPVTGAWDIGAYQSGGAPPPSCLNACDINCDGADNVADVQQEINMALGKTTCTNQSGSCTVTSVQKVINAALGGACVAP